MKKSFTLFTLLIMLSVTFFGQQWNGIKSDSPVPVQQQLLQSSDESIVIKFKVDGFFMQPVITPNGREYIISVPDMVSMLEAGAPDIPMYAVSAIIPDLSLMQVRVLEFNYVDIPDMVIAPSKGNFPRNVDPETVPYIYGEAYQTDAFYPASLAHLQEPYILRDYRGQAVSVFPFAYNPINKTLRVFTEMVVEIYSDGPGGENQFVRDGDIIKMEPEFRAIYNSHFINFDQSQRYIVAEEGNMLVISHGPFMAAMEPFIEWKKTIGRPIEMVDVATIGTTSTAIKAFVVNYYNTNGLTHLLLVGDHQQVPSHAMSGGFSDNFYGYILGSDSYNELFVGRFSAETVAHVETQVQRTIEYERDMNETDTWLNIGIGIARNEGAGMGHNGGEADYVHMDYIRDSLLNFTYATVYREYDGNVPGLPNTNATQMMQRFNAGASITNFCNHGHQNGWSVGNFSSTHVSQLTNTGKLPYIWSVACDNGRFTNGTCFAETWLRATHNGQPSGAVATMMSWISQPWVPPMTGQDEMVTILVEKRDHIKRTMAGVSINGSMKMVQMHGTSGRETHDTWILFGDPSLMLRTNVPSAIAVDHMPAAFLGFTEFTVNADAEDAIVSLTMNGEIVGTAYVTDGTAVVEFPPLTEPGEMTVTVFGWNRITYMQTIDVIPAAGPFIAFSGSLIDDSQGGNNNGQIDFDENIILGVALKNLGIENATNVVASITTNSPYVNIIVNEQEYGVIEPDELIMITDAFQFEVADGIPNNTPLSFALEIVGEEDTWNGTINLTAYAPDFRIGSYLINDMSGNANGRLDPGETADIVIVTENKGGSASVEAIGSLFLNDPWITVNNSMVEFGSFEAGQLVNAFFNVTVSENTPLGHAFGFSYAVNAGEYSAEKEFTAKVGLILEDFETGDFSSFNWTFAGHQPWTITSSNPYEGTYSARSGNITHSQNTRMILQYNVGTNDTISFYRRVSSESGYDYMRFYINGQQMAQWSGNVAWGKVSFPVTAGPKIFMWEYMKDHIVSSGEDAAWVDYISFPPPVATSGSAGSDAEICETETHQLNGSASHFNSVEWTSSGDGVFNNPNILNPVYTPGADDIETSEVLLTLTIDGATAVITDEVLLTIHKNPDFFAGSDVSVCLNGIFEVKDAHGSNFDVLIWETSGTGSFDDHFSLTPIYTPSDDDYAAGMVVITATVHGFESCAEASSSFELHFFGLPTVEIAGSQEICLGDSAEITLTLTGAAPWFVTMNNGLDSMEVPTTPFTFEVAPEATTTYQMYLVTDNNGCANVADGAVTISLNYAPEAPAMPIGSDTVDHFLVSSSTYQILLVDDANVYEWEINPSAAGSLTVEANEVTIEWNTDYIGEAELVATAGNDCGLSPVSPALQIQLYSTVGLTESLLAQLAIYPNPSDGKFTLELNNKYRLQGVINIRSLIGELVYSESVQFDLQASTRTLDLGHLPNGAYILSIESKDNKTFRRIIIQK